MAAIVCAGFLASCMSVSIPQDHFIGQAYVERRSVLNELVTRFPAGTLVSKLVDDLKSQGANCIRGRVPNLIECEHKIEIKSFLLLPMLVPLTSDETLTYHIVIHGRDGLIEAIEYKGYVMYGGRWAL
jgi:hypothetical protein